MSSKNESKSFSTCTLTVTSILIGSTFIVIHPLVRQIMNMESNRWDFKFIFESISLIGDFKLQGTLAKPNI